MYLLKNSPLCSQLGTEGFALELCLVATKGTAVMGGEVSFSRYGHMWRFGAPHCPQCFFLCNISLNTSAKRTATNSLHIPLVIFLISHPDCLLSFALLFFFRPGRSSPFHTNLCGLIFFGKQNIYVSLVWATRTKIGGKVTSLLLLTTLSLKSRVAVLVFSSLFELAVVFLYLRLLESSGMKKQINWQVRKETWFSSRFLKLNYGLPYKKNC